MEKELSMRIKAFMTALVLLTTILISRSPVDARQSAHRGALPGKVFCRCVPHCPGGYFCEQDGLGGCFCSPI